ncbi:MAG: hypothetical protein NT155_04585 [Candidatus Staskawiczbacteria bacterium]|nr:hypothetical protein [Candidatus Staskawiczbacteria bacterium]
MEEWNKAKNATSQIVGGRGLLGYAGKHKFSQARISQFAGAGSFLPRGDHRSAGKNLAGTSTSSTRAIV